MQETDTRTIHRILEEGKKEFLAKGFKGASIRNIVKNVGVTTGAFYFYFKDKEALFSALVSPAADGLKEILVNALQGFRDLPAQTQADSMNEYAAHGYEAFISHIYQHFDLFKLLITCSEGSSFSDFVHDLADLDAECALKFIGDTSSDALTSGRCTPELIHIVTSAFFAGFFEIVIHDMSQKDAKKHIERLSKFFSAGWDTILKL